MTHGTRSPACAGLLKEKRGDSLRETMQHNTWTIRQWAGAGAALWLLLTLPVLGLVPLFDYDETIYAQTAVDMWRHHAWIVPMANGMEFFEKPPFIYYLMDLSFWLFGENSFAARLPSALFTLATAALLFRFLEARGQGRAGLLAAAIFLSMFEVGLLAHAAILDAGLNFFITGSLLAYLRWLDTQALRHARWCAAMMGAAVALKGPVGVVVPLMVILIERAWAGELRASLRRIPWLHALPWFLLLALPWYLMIVIAHGWEFLRQFILVHNIGRAMQPMQGHGGGWHYYLVVFAVSSLPWLFWLPWTFRQAWRAKSAQLRALLRFTLVWIASVIVLFTFAQTKLPHYISCVYPALALALASAWQQADSRHMPGYLVPLTVLLLLPILLLLSFLPLLYPSLTALVHHPRALAILAQGIEPSWWVASGGALLLFALAALAMRQRLRLSLPAAFVALGLTLQWALLLPLASFAALLIQGPAMQAASIVRALPEQARIYSYNLNAPSVSFYSGRNYQILLGEEGKRRWRSAPAPKALLMREESLADFPSLQRLRPTMRRGGFLLFWIEE